MQMRLNCLNPSDNRGNHYFGYCALYRQTRYLLRSPAIFEMKSKESMKFSLYGLYEEWSSTTMVTESYLRRVL